jgi:hypothetical protein
MQDTVDQQPQLQGGGSAAMTAAAWASFLDAWYSPSAETIRRTLRLPQPGRSYWRNDFDRLAVAPAYWAYCPLLVLKPPRSRAAA